MAQALEKFDAHGAIIKVAVEIEQMGLDQRLFLVAEGGGMADADGRGKRAVIETDPGGIDAVGRNEKVAFEVGRGETELAAAAQAGDHAGGNFEGAAEEKIGVGESAFAHGLADERAGNFLSGDLERRHDDEAETAGGTEAEQEFDVALPAAPEMETRPFDDNGRAQGGDNDALNEIFGGELENGPRVVGADDGFDSGGVEEFETALEREESPGPPAATEDNFGMRFEGEGQGWSAGSAGRSNGLLDDPTVAEVDAVEVADGQGGAGKGVVQRENVAN